MNWKNTFSCRRIVEGITEGEVLISKDEILFYLCDPETGKIIERGHDLEGKSVSRKILIFPGGKGSSSVQVDGLYQLISRNNAPKAMIIMRPDTILVTSAIIFGIPLLDKVEKEFYDNINDRDVLFVDANNERISIIK